MDTIPLTIDGRKITCSAQSSILEAAEQNGIKIPRLCHHPDLKPFGACRMCLVEDEKTGRLMASCVTPVARDMVLQTASPRIVKHRRNIVRLMIAEHPESCIVCSKGNRCQLRQVAANLGIGETNLYHMPNFKPLEQANPFIIRDLSKCILCGKCIRADHELVVVGAIDYNMRGFGSRPATVHELGLEQSSCTFCGTCVSLCPTGALSTKNTRFVGSPAYEAVSICGFCGVGCRLAVGAADKHVIEVNPAHQPQSVNGATLCVRGHFAHDFLNSSERLVGPLLRKRNNDGTAVLAPVSWEEALDQVASRLMEIKHENGPQSIAFLGSSKCSSEENYLFQKIARVFIGTNNIDSGGYIFGQSLLKVLDEKTDGGYRMNRLADLAQAEVIFILGADPNHSVPVVGYYLKRAARQGVPLIVADPRRTELTGFSRLWLPVKPQSDLELFNGLTALLHEKEAYDAKFIDRYTEGFSLFRYGLSSLDIEKVSRKTGLSKDALKAAAELIKGKKIAVVIGNGILQQKSGMHTLGAILNLTLMTGSLGSKGAGIYVLAKENNQQGAMDMGALPDMLPGRHPLDDQAVRKKWEKNWKTNLSPDAGLNMVRIIEAAEKGNLKALFVMGENPLRALPESDRVRRALQNLDFLVVQDIINSETAQIADAVLAGAALSEKQGSFTNLEGRIQSFNPVVPPPGKAKADWEILDLLACRLGAREPYDSLEKMRKEIRQFLPMYESLDGRQEAWIKMTGTKKTLFESNAAELISFYPVVFTEEEPADQEYPFTAIVGTKRYHLGSGTRTGASKRIQEFASAGKVEMCPQDADDLELQNEDTVVVRSQFGTLTRAIKLKPGLSPGSIFVPAGVNKNEAMNLFGLSDLTKPGAAGWKTCKVKIEKA
ncbi:MAG: molybdopterin-dependent oxidoreductase [Desulfobacterales bacterium]|nr:MAG: molybdopterin-dependent oxidoreductase [Desulfobacterales bacterium]